MREIVLSTFTIIREIRHMKKISIRDISVIIKRRDLKRQKYKYQELSFKDYKLLSKEKRSIELVDLLYQYYCFMLTLIIPLFLYLQVIQKRCICHYWTCISCSIIQLNCYIPKVIARNFYKTFCQTIITGEYIALAWE